MNIIKRKMLIASIIVTMFSVFTFSNVAAAYTVNPVANGSYTQMKGRVYWSYISGWLNITSTTYNYATLVDEGYDNCNYDQDYVYINTSFTDAAFKFFSSTAHFQPSYLLGQFKISKGFGTDSMFIRYRDSNNDSHYYSAPLIAPWDQELHMPNVYTFADGTKGSLWWSGYLTLNAERGPSPFNQKPYYIGQLLIWDLSDTIIKDSIEVGIKSGYQMFGSEVRISCVKLEYSL